MKLKAQDGSTVRVDKDIYELLKDKKISIIGEGTGYAAFSRNGVYVYIHRFVLNEPQGSSVRFKNKNKRDCRRSNLVEEGRKSVIKNTVTEYIYYIDELKRYIVCYITDKEVYVGKFLYLEDAKEALSGIT